MSRPAESSGQPAPSTGEGIDEALIGIAVSGYHKDITGALLDGCYATLRAAGVPESNIITMPAPGAFELPSVARLLIQRERVNAVICLGCIIKGETKHDEYIANAIATGISKLSLDSRKPVIFGVLTTNNREQAMARAGGAAGNKGIEAANAALAMVRLDP